MIALADDEVHVHYLLPDEITDPRLLAAYDALLAADERERRDRYRFDRSKIEYLLTRALVRTTLSRYAPVAPRAWTFVKNQWGCPAIEDPAHAHIRFNLSNTRGLIACAVTRDRDVGVDVEDTSRDTETVTIADRFFSPSEVEALRAQPADAQQARFFDYWTLKEAYIKARGMGLAIPLDQFSFILDDVRRVTTPADQQLTQRTGPKSPIRIAFDPALADDAATWQFEQLELSPAHTTSLAVRRGIGPDLRVIVHRTIPLL